MEIEQALAPIANASNDVESDAFKSAVGAPAGAVGVVHVQTDNARRHAARAVQACVFICSRYQC